MIRVGFVGLGWVVQRIWLPAVLARQDWLVVGAVEPNAAAFEEVQRQQSVKRCCNIAHLIQEKPDLVIVASPNSMHARHTTALLKQGIAVLVEKPACLSESEATEMCSASRRGNAPLFVSHAARYRADVCELRKLVTSDRIGQIRCLELSWVRARGVPSRVDWFTSAQQSGGGVLMDLGWHIVDLGQWILDQPRIESVTAIASRNFLGQPNVDAAWRNDVATKTESTQDVEDTVFAFLKTNNGIGISLHLAWASHEAIDTTELIVHGTRGIARLKTTFGFSPNRVVTPSLSVSTYGNLDEVPIPETPIGQEYGLLLSDIAINYPFGHVRENALANMRHLTSVISQIYAAAGSLH